MSKFGFGRVVAAVTIVAALFLIVGSVKAQGLATWLDSPLFIKKQADVKSEPPTFSGQGNIDCTQIAIYTCAVPAPFGEVTENGSVALNYSSDYKPIATQVENRYRFLPIPNSDTGISYTTEPIAGWHIYFNHNVYTELTPVRNYLYQLTAYHINQPPDGKLADKSGKLLAADYGSMSFSSDSQWMVVSEPNVATLRVNLRNYDVLPFGSGFDYTNGSDPTVRTAISNDGRYAVVAAKSSGYFRLYDLSTCADVPDSFNKPVACQSRDLAAFMRQQVSDYYYAHNIRFLNDGTLAVYALQKSPDGKLKNSRFIISTNPINDQLDYLALGDSYISGEGAYDYVPGTDTAGNKCHLSYLSYPFLIGQQLDYNSYHSVACAGAKTEDITDTSSAYEGQASADKINFTTRAFLDETGLTSSYLASFTPGYLDQLDFVKTYQPSAITVSIGGNDMGFSDILKPCALYPTTCNNTYEDRLELVNLIDTKVFKSLVSTYKDLKAAGPPDMRIYAIGYPQIAKPGGDCGINVRLDEQEIQFSQQLVDYLDQVIQAAAAKAGVYYVDTQDALNGHRLCEASGNELAMNGVTFGNDLPVDGLGPVGNESYHPNAFGYQLLRDKILAVTSNLTAPMPAAEPSLTVPTATGQPILDAPKSGRNMNILEPDDDIAADTTTIGSTLGFTIDGAEHALPPFADLQAELHSNPIELGNYVTSAKGDITGQVAIPADVPAGYHVLHFYGTDIAGRAIDIYKTVFVADKPVATSNKPASASGQNDQTPKPTSTATHAPQNHRLQPGALATTFRAATLGASIFKTPKHTVIAQTTNTKLQLSYALGGALILTTAVLVFVARQKPGARV